MKKNRKFFMLCICLMSILLFAGACADQAADDPKPTASSTPKTTEIPASAAPQSANTETSAPTATPVELPQDLTYTEIKTGEGSLKDYLYVETTDGEAANGPENLLDGNYETRWAYANSTLDYQLDVLFTRPCYLDRVQTTWFEESRIYFYELWAVCEATGREDLIGDRELNEEPGFTEDSVGGLVDYLYYIFFDNSTANKWVSIYEIDAIGFCVWSETYEISEKAHTITIPQETSLEDFLSRLQIDGTFQASLGTADGSTSSVADGNVLRISCGDAVAEYLILIAE